MHSRRFSLFLHVALINNNNTCYGNAIQLFSFTYTVSGVVNGIANPWTIKLIFRVFSRKLARAEEEPHICIFPALSLIMPRVQIQLLSPSSSLLIGVLQTVLAASFWV